ncbi:hypothetical protein BDN67DRAFT_105727 [Paxillus ammoniavirescens]|nr:hypothetical protein BDN67DRAFT_105727 [Paxillus ammoniavirescens]
MHTLAYEATRGTERESGDNKGRCVVHRIVASPTRLMATCYGMIPGVDDQPRHAQRCAMSDIRKLSPCLAHFLHPIQNTAAAFTSYRFILVSRSPYFRAQLIPGYLNRQLRQHQVAHSP